jgi:DNA-binding NtrC family response regulator
MSKRVLILDDDLDFNTLLTDIYMQADFEVVSKTSPNEALEILHAEQFDIVITDQKMPEILGSDFMRKVHEVDPVTPVIMVSGYLDNDTIRDLIRDGVAGVFLKPLNIMGLLSRSNDLVKESQRLRSLQKKPAEEKEVSVVGSRVGFPFRSFPCRSEAAVKFARKLYDYRNFKTSLCLVGEKGTHFRAICEDILGMDSDLPQSLVYLNKKSFNEAGICSAVAEHANNGVKLLNFVVLDLASLEQEEKALLPNLVKRDNPYSTESIQIRIIVCCHQSVDMLFEDGLIDDVLYFGLGTTELNVPPLRNCVEDIPVMAQQFIVDAVRERGLAAVPQIQPEAKRWLAEYEWPGNAVELCDWMARALIRSGSGDITLSALHEAESLVSANAIDAALNQTMESARKEFVAAMGLFFQNDVPQTAAALGFSQQAVEPLMN